MAYTLIRECLVIMYYNGEGYLFDAFSDFDFSQTTTVKSSARKTLHNKTGINNTYANTKSSASFSIEVLATDTAMERVFFQALGYSLEGSLLRYPTTLAVNPDSCDLYVVSKNSSYRIRNAYLQHVDVAMGLGNALRFELSFDASEVLPCEPIPTSAGLITQGDILKHSPIYFKMNDHIFNNIINAGVSSQQEITWRNDRSIHDVGTMYTPRVATLSKASFNINVVTHRGGNITTPDKPFHTDIELRQSNLTYKITNAFVTKRITPDDVFQDAFDITLSEYSTNITVEYGEPCL